MSKSFRGSRRSHPAPGQDRRAVSSSAPDPVFGKSPQLALAVPIAAVLALLMPWTAIGGDLLRGGRPAAPVGGARANAGASAVDPAAAAAQANARDALARTSRAIEAVKAMQSSARVKAQTAPVSYLGRVLPSVPNGLAPGGLQVAPGVPKILTAPAPGEDPTLWQGAKLPKQQVAGGSTNVRIEQTDSRALLTWETFNVGKNTKVTFDQSAGGNKKSQWIAFNKIQDPSGVPSQILGSIKADGQVYLINRNGIVFGGTSSINTHTLVASSLNINENLVKGGLLNNPKAEFLFSAPTATDPAFVIGASKTYTLADTAFQGVGATVTSVKAKDGTVLTAGTDYTFATDTAGKTTVKFTDAGAVKAAGMEVTIAYLRGAGHVMVNPGASLTSPTTSSHVGGRIMLVGGNVTNAGRISTPDGQTILAAGLQAGLAAHAATDPSLRGLDVFVGAQSKGSGIATNTGLVNAPRASVTMAGRSVQQLGVINSSTSVALNGRISLLADYDAYSNPAAGQTAGVSVVPFYFRSSGAVTLGPHSVTQVLPETSSAETIASTRLPLQSRLDLRGRTIHMAANSTILGPNAAVALLAGQWAPAPSPQAPPIFAMASSAAVRPQISIDSGAIINVAGSADVSLPITQNLLSVEVRGPQTADSPLQRTGVVRGTTLNVDLRILGPWDPTLNDGAGDYAWVGTPLVDARGYRDLVQRGVSELTADGGSVNISSGGSVILREGSKIDVSGGVIKYEGGMMKTTRLLSGGQLMDISQATPDRVYDGFYTGTFTVSSPKYGITQTFANPLALTGEHYENGYLSGAAGGSIAIRAPSMALDGTLLGRTVRGPRQRNEGPTPGALSLVFEAQDLSPAFFAFSPTPPRIVFSKGAQSAPAPFTLDELGNALDLPADRLATVHLSPDLFSAENFGSLTVENSDGEILIPAGIAIKAPAGTGRAKSSLTLSGAKITVLGSVYAPGGDLSFTAYNVTPYRDHYFPPGPVETPPPDVNLNRGGFVLGTGASLSTNGLLIDDWNVALVRDLQPIAVAGGSVKITSFSADLQPGSSIDVSGGVHFDYTGRRTYGNGGSIEIRAGRDPDPQYKTVLGGTLNLQAKLRGFSGAEGGSLTIQAPLVQIGGTAPEVQMVKVDGKLKPRLDFNGTKVDPLTFLLLQPDFFNQGGFTRFTVAGLGVRAGDENFLPAVSIAPGTILAPHAESFLAIPNGGENGEPLLTRMLMPVAQRTPVSLAFEAKGVGTTRGDFVMGAGAVIRTEPFPTATRGVSITAQTAEIQGSICAPGGAISISAGSSAGLFPLSAPLQAVTTVHLSPSTVLSAAGAAVIFRDGRGFRTGAVYNGGSISIAGNILAERGSVLDVSGASDILDLTPFASTLDTPARDGGLLGSLSSSLLGQPQVPTIVASSAGSITLAGAQMLFTDAKLVGRAGGPGALGGSLTISSGRFVDPGIPPTVLDIGLNVTQSGNAIPGSFRPRVNAIGQQVSPRAGVDSGGGFVTVDSFASGGFDAINLKGTVAFHGPVSISAGRELRVGDGGVIYADSDTYLAAPYVALGTVFQAPLTAILQAQDQPIFTSNGNAFYFGPTYGTGKLTVDASLIDVGNLSLQGIGTTTLNASGDGIRGNGILNAAGTLNLHATQIYPTTAGYFSVFVYDRNVVVKSSSAGSTQVTLASATLPPGFRVGSPLLGSTVTKIEGNIVTLAANANATISANKPVTFAPNSGTINVTQDGTPVAPLSAGGTLSLFAANLNQAGTLLAPGGTINLGWDGNGSSPKDYISGAGVTGTGDLKLSAAPIAQHINLQAGSITSVALIDFASGNELLIPYGLNVNGTQWVDPLGTDITAAGVVQKAINIAGVNVNQQAGSTVDLRGGGDFYSYRWVPGPGGSKDILSSTGNAASGLQRYAIVPSYGGAYAPYAPFNPNNEPLGNDPGYVDSSLRLGDRITLQASPGLPAGEYTLLPARYALLPGGFLVTAQPGAPIGNVLQPDGSSIVSGSRVGQTTLHRFEIAPSDVLRMRGEYQDFSANTFLAEGALKNKLDIPRLPQDAGYLLFEARTGLSLNGTVLARGATGAHDGLIDISALNTDLTITGGSRAGHTGIVLNAAKLSSFGAESLLLGGVRKFGPDNTATVTVTTNNVTLDNAGTPLTGADVVLVAKQKLTLEPGATVAAGGSAIEAQTLLLSGPGVLVRTSTDPNARIVRTAIGNSTVPTLTVGAGATISGTSINLDSTYSTVLDPNAILRGQYVSLNSGRISIQFDPAVAVPANPGLILAGNVLQGLRSSRSLSLLSYNGLDLYGSGTLAFSGALALHAPEIRGFGTGVGTTKFAASRITLDNPNADPAAIDLAAPLLGTLEFDAGSFRLGSGNIEIRDFASVKIVAPGGFVTGGTGSLETPGNFTAVTPSIVGASSTNYAITARGDMAFTGGGAVPVSGALGATLRLSGASVNLASHVVLHSGVLDVRATGLDATDGITISGTVDLSGSARQIFDLIGYTSGGSISLASASGNVEVTDTGALLVSAPAGGGNGGSVSITIPKGEFILAGRMLGKAGAGGTAGNFSLDAGEIVDTVALFQTLADGSFTSQVNLRAHTGDVLINTQVDAHTFQLSLDGGSITIGDGGFINAAGKTGGEIRLVAAGSVTLASGSVLTVEADDFDHAGKGGAVYLEAGSSVLNGGNYTHRNTAVVDIQAGSLINVGVKSTYDVNGVADPTKIAASAALGHFSGTLHLRAPQTAGGDGVQINPVLGSIQGLPSHILVEGYRVYQPGGGFIDSGLFGQISADGNIFGGAADTITNTLFTGANAALKPAVVVVLGAEIVNPTGDLTLTQDWDLATFRFGSRNAPGVLTMRAAGNLVFNGALSDGFDVNGSVLPVLFTAPLMAYNALLPATAQSWSYRLAAGADFGAADFSKVAGLGSLADGSGSLKLGQPFNPLFPSRDNMTLIALLEQNVFQVIRTGSGNIDIAAARDVQLLNPFAAIYTVGTQIPDATKVLTAGDFEIPASQSVSQNELGVFQELPSIPQYSFGGGNITIFAQNDVRHTNASGGLESERQLPTSWLFRRSILNPDGTFAVSPYGEIASTTWWVDFSRFYEGIGTLGGGNATVTAGRNVENVDVVAATNARMAGRNASGAIRADAANLIELGGGDITIKAGHDIDGGVYYVERGHGLLSAGNTIRTNPSRAPEAAVANGGTVTAVETTWLPTTFFLGKGSFDISAQGNILMGPVVNPFLAPPGVSNNFLYRSYFSTYAAESAVDVTSLGGSVTLRTGTSDGTDNKPILLNWLNNVGVVANSGPNPPISFYEPWARVAETDLRPFTTALSVLPSILRVTALGGDINLAGNLTLLPSAHGTIDLVANGAINGLQPIGRSPFFTIWDSSRIVVSDANPASIPGLASALSPAFPTTTSETAREPTSQLILLPLDALFAESGSAIGAQASIEVKQALHDPSILHADDTQPIRLYAGGGNLADITLFSPKAARIFASKDISDIGLYLQNVTDADFSVVSAGQDITAYNPNSPLLQQAKAAGNSTLSAVLNVNPAQSGDIQINGPGTLEVLAGRNLDLGAGRNTNLASDLGIGISSVGNLRNPALPFDGARLIVGAGIPGPGGLGSGSLDFKTFIETIATEAVLQQYLPELQQTRPNLGNVTFGELNDEQKASLALDLFYLILRDSAADPAAAAALTGSAASASAAPATSGDPSTTGAASTGKYAAGFSAIAALFTEGSGNATQADIALSSRSVKTSAGGDINMIAPHGGISLGFDIPKSGQVPPGIITEFGGNISIFADQSVQVGALRIFTLRGGNEIIWSSKGDIAAGSASKTVQTAPPTRVVIDAQSADVQTDLAGLATGGGIGVLASVADVPPGNVALIAPAGVVDAGDAGIRATGNLSISATAVLNASNIQAGGATAGVPAAPAVAAVNVGGLTSASNAAGAGSEAAKEASRQAPPPPPEPAPSLITVEVTIGSPEAAPAETEEERRKRLQREQPNLNP